MPSLAEEELPVTILTAKIATPEETPGVRRSSRVKFKTNTHYILSMSGKQYETLYTQVECEETLYPYAHMFICQELIEEVPDAETVTMTQLSLKAGMQLWKGKGPAAAKSETKQLHFRDTFNPKNDKYLNE